VVGWYSVNGARDVGFVGTPPGDTTISQAGTDVQPVGVDAAGDVYLNTNQGAVIHQYLFNTPITVSGATQVTLTAVNSAGEYAGVYYDANGVQHGLVGVQNVNVTVDPAGSEGTFVNTIDGNGDVGGEYFDASFNVDGFIDVGGTITTLQAFGSTDTVVTGINNSGQVVGDYLDSNGIQHGFLYQNGTYSTLDPAGSVGTFVSGITNAGEIYGTFDNAAGVEQGFTATAVPACYCPGTAVRTEAGEAAIETLAIGDRVVVGNGAVRAIRWIGRRSYSTRFLRGRPDLLPVRITAGAFGAGLPHTDLLVSPKHAMLLDGVLVPAAELVNGTTIRREGGMAQVDYIHLELESHDVIWANGVLSETFVDDDSRAMFSNAADYASLYGAAAGPARFCAERVSGGPVLERIKARLDHPVALAA
jgi:probable HAF family extracellular repeat protein